jgi:sirohydrochlorin cobaltochelatase
MAGPETMNTALPPPGVVLFGHGSRDPAWRAPMDAVAARIRERAPAVMVRCAFLELTAPDLPTVADEFAAAGVREVTVLPLFLGVGRHAREDLPAIVDELRRAQPDTQWRLLPAVGEDSRLLDLLATLAIQGDSTVDA